MWPSVSILCILVALANARSVPYYPPLSSDLVNHINKLNTTWKVSTGMVLGEDKGTISVGLGGCGLGFSPPWLHQTSFGPSWLLR